jgi:hypothetical protein
MPKNIVELISNGQSIHAVKNVERTLAKKLLNAIAEQKTQVARDAYGTLDEFYGGDEPPDYVNNSDNAYAAFFANALKKFGVNGPEDFQDDVTKQRFFDYVDHNWRAQDSVQMPIQGANGGSIEQGTQTALPSPATPPMAPTAPTGGSPTTAQGNDPSLATMAPAGPSIDKTAPLDQSGQDQTLNGIQNAQSGEGGDQYGGDPLAQDDSMGDEGGMDQGMDDGTGGMSQGMGAGNGEMAGGGSCPMCKGTGKAACPTCGRPHEMGGGAPGAMGGLDQDPDLEIGPEDDGSGMMGGDDEDGMQGDQFGGDGQDGLAGDSHGLEGGDEGMLGDEGGDQMGANGDPTAQSGDEEETDDPFDDEDAYTIDQNDFAPQGGEGGGGNEDGFAPEGGAEDEGGADQFGEGGFEGEDDGSDEGDQGFGTGDPDADIDNEASEEGDDEFGGGDPATGAGQEADLEGDDQDPDLEIGDGSEDEDQGDDFSDEGDDGDEDDEQDDEDAADQDDDAEVPKKKAFGEALKHRSWSRKERKADSKKPNRAAGKKEAKLAEDFGFGLDDAEDDVFLAEALMMQQKAPEPDPGLGKLINYVQQQLSRIKKMRNTMLMQLRRQRAVIKKDPALDNEAKMDAMKQLAQMAKDNRKFFKGQAKLVKAMFTGNLSGGGSGMEGDEEAPEGMDQDQGMDQGADQGQDQGFPPEAGGDEGDMQGDDMQGDDEGMDADDDAEMDDQVAPSAPAGFPAKKKAAFPPKADDGGDDADPDLEIGDEDAGDEGDDEEAAPAPAAKKPFPPKAGAAKPAAKKPFPPKDKIKESESAEAKLKMAMLKARR